MGKIVNIMDFFTKDKTSSSAKDVLEKVEAAWLTDEQVDAVREYALFELKVMLGVDYVPEEVIEGIEPLFFNEIQNIYDTANADCYFCSQEADPNAEVYGKVRRACPMCTLKLKSFLLAAGVPLDKVSGMLKKAHR